VARSQFGAINRVVVGGDYSFKIQNALPLDKKFLGRAFLWQGRRVGVFFEVYSLIINLEFLTKMLCPYKVLQSDIYDWNDS
jgi:hypothetical protein